MINTKALLAPPMWRALSAAAAIFWAGAAACAGAPPQEAQQQVAFLTQVYQAYLGHGKHISVEHFKPATFYSASAQRLLAENDVVCRTLSRGDDICGYSADGDPLLDTQETAPNLNFKNARFSAKPAGKNMVDVSFSVWPGGGKRAQRAIRYTLVQDGEQWRVDDLIEQREGRFDPKDAMRARIAGENTVVREGAGKVSEVWSWLAIYMGQAMDDRFARFIGFPFELCDAQQCTHFTQADAALGKAIKAVRERFLCGGGAKMAAITDAQQSARFGFALSERQGALWLTQVDLRKMPACAVSQ
ncbi:MAG: hypothetical protein V4582_23495 [Pseudomonadota bacterium]